MTHSDRYDPAVSIPNSRCVDLRGCSKVHVVARHPQLLRPSSHRVAAKAAADVGESLARAPSPIRERRVTRSHGSAAAGGISMRRPAILPSGRDLPGSFCREREHAARCERA